MTPIARPFHHRFGFVLSLLALAACGASSGNGGGLDGGNAGTRADASGGGEGGGDADGGVTSGVSAVKAFYFGHSLVGHHLPQMVGGFARARGKTYAVHGQVGWGTPLMSHWRWDGSFDASFVPAGFPEELPNTVLFDQHGHAALESGAYDVIVLTETNDFASGSPGAWNEGCDKSIDFGGCSIEMASNLVRLGRMHRADQRVLLYTNWKNIDDQGGIDNWLADIAANVGWWENLADKVDAETGSKIQVVPVAKILARVVTEARAGQIDGLANYMDLFSDAVHINETGFYVVALAHYAAMFRDTPVGLPRTVDVVTGDRTALSMNGFEVSESYAAHVQNVVWEELQAYPRSGVND